MAWILMTYPDDKGHWVSSVTGDWFNWGKNQELHEVCPFLVNATGEVTIEIEGIGSFISRGFSVIPSGNRRVRAIVQNIHQTSPAPWIGVYLQQVPYPACLEGVLDPDREFKITTPSFATWPEAMAEEMRLGL